LREAVNDLGGIRKLIVGDIPDPGAPSPSTILRDAWQKRRRVASRQTRWAKGDRAAAVSNAEALSSAAEISDRPFIADGGALFIERFRTPNGAEFHLAGLGGSVRLLAGAAHEFLGA